MFLYLLLVYFYSFHLPCGFAFLYFPPMLLDLESVEKYDTFRTKCRLVQFLQLTYYFAFLFELLHEVENLAQWPRIAC